MSKKKKTVIGIGVGVGMLTIMGALSLLIVKRKNFKKN